MATIKVGESVQLPCEPPKYVSSNTQVATVNQNGVVTAVSPGTANIRAVTAITVVTADIIPDPAPTPDPIPSGPTNEPSGLALIGERPFNSVDENPLFDDHDNGSLRFTTDETAPFSPPNVGQAFYPAGFTSKGIGVGESNISFSGKRYLYVRWYLKYSSNWYGHDSGNNKNAFIWSNGSNPSLVFENLCQGYGEMVPGFVGQDIVHPLADEIDWRPNIVPSARFIRGQWHQVELYVVGNTSGNADGSIAWWLDGVKIGEVLNLRFNSGATNWTMFKNCSTWGGVGGPNVPADQYLNVDHVYVSGK